MKYRANFYIDGFNLYYGICDTKDKTLLWLDIIGLCKHLKRKQEHLNKIHYFTTIPYSPPGQVERHKKFIKLLEIQSYQSDAEIIIHRGRFKFKKITCKATCGEVFERSEEKESDVALGCQMVRDAYKEECEEIYIITGDGDMMPAIKIIKNDFPKIGINVIFPPRRHCYDFEKVADYFEDLSPYTLSKYRMRKKVYYDKNKYIKMPRQWEEQSKVIYEPLVKG